MIRPFCAPVEIHSDESLLSAIARSAEVNVLPATATLLQHANVNAPRTAFVPFTQSAASANIGQLMGISPIEVARRMLPRLEESERTTVDWFGTPLERRFVEANVRRLSFAALTAGPYARSIWMIRPLLYCPDNFDALQSNCPACQKKLGWTRSLGVAVCEHCEKPLTGRSPKLPAESRREYQNIAALVDMDPKRRDASAALLPLPFGDWDHGDIFAAAIDLGALAQNASRTDCRNLWRQLATGDFSPLRDNGIFQGWDILLGGPNAVDNLLRKIIGARRNDGNLRQVLGPISRFFHSKSKSPLCNLMEKRVGLILRELKLPLKVMSRSRALCTERTESIAMWDAMREFSISDKLLKRLAVRGDCLLGKSAGETGVHLFDRVKLQKAVGQMRSGVGIFKFSNDMGMPAYAISALIEHGLVERILDENVQLLAPHPLLEPASVADLYDLFASLPPPKNDSNLVSLSTQLASDLSPFAWSDTLLAIKRGQLRAFLAAGGESWSERVVAHPGALRTHLEQARTLPLPDIYIPACTAAPIIGVNDVVLGRAAESGLLRKHAKGFLLEDLAVFRSTYVFPSEISKWFDGSGRSFANAMAEAGLCPAATLHKSNIWRRSDVNLVFGSQQIRNFEAVESAVPE
ncbi:hypothetical protein [Sphingopyxis chilensis]|uniref:hypothetical protein n=1 Tax=Sphingopyxis chilensis TaxID=180400 RepID=UPI002DDC961A|nr:hypothetical protein [Sphingopyxis chilensis]